MKPLLTLVDLGTIAEVMPSELCIASFLVESLVFTTIAGSPSLGVLMVVSRASDPGKRYTSTLRMQRTLRRFHCRVNATISPLSRTISWNGSHGAVVDWEIRLPDRLKLWQWRFIGNW